MTWAENDLNRRMVCPDPSAKKTILRPMQIISGLKRKCGFPGGLPGIDFITGEIKRALKGD